MFENGLLPSALPAQHLAFDQMRVCIARRRRQDLIDQPFRTCDVGRRRVGHSIEHSARERARQSALCLYGLRIERQRVLEQPNPLYIAVA